MVLNSGHIHPSSEVTTVFPICSNLNLKQNFKIQFHVDLQLFGSK